MSVSGAFFDEPVENDSLSQQISIFTAIIKELRSFKTIIHMCDDITITILTAADLGDPVWESLGDLAVGGVLLLVTAIELQETNEELAKLEKQITQIKNELALIADEENNGELIKRRNILRIQLAHRENQFSKTLINQKLCWFAIAGSGIYAIAMMLSTTANALIQVGISSGNVLMGGLTTALHFSGMVFFPPLVMGIILIKQMIDLVVLYDQLNEQQEIFNHPDASFEEKDKAKKEIEKIKLEIQYKRVEIFAQALLTVSFILAAAALSGISLGALPLALMIAGAAIGLLCKVHELYTKNKAKIKNLEHKVEQKIEENKHDKKELIKASQQAEVELENKIEKLSRENKEQNLQIVKQNSEIEQLKQNNEQKDIEIAQLKEKLKKFQKSKIEVTSLKQDSTYSPRLFTHFKCVPPDKFVKNRATVIMPV